MSDLAALARMVAAWLGAVTDRRRWVAPLAAVVGTVAGAVLLAQPTAWTVVWAVVVLAVTSLPGVAASWWRREEEAANGNAVVDAYQQLHQALTPLATAAADLAQAATWNAELFASSAQHATEVCASLTSPEDVRAILFRVDESGLTMTQFVRSGRLGDSIGFDSTNKRGQDAFRALKSGKTVQVPSIERARAEKQRAWSGSGQGYEAFITAHIAVGDVGYGLLTVDAPDPDAFDATDVVFVELVAAMLGVTFAERDRHAVRIGEGG